MQTVEYKQKDKRDRTDYKEPLADIRRLLQLAPDRSIRRRSLDASREERRQQRRAKARIAHGHGVPVVGDGESV